MNKMENNLKKIREKKKLSLAQVSKETKIHPEILKALEESEFDKIPNHVYVRSFIKKYASYLGLEPQPIIENYNSVHKSVNEQLLYVEKKKLRFDYMKILFIIKVFLISVLAIIVIYLVANFIRHIIYRPVTKQEVITEQIPKPTEVIPPEIFQPEDVAERMQPLMLTIKTKNDVWLQIKVDGRKIFQNVLTKGSKEEWQAEKNFEIWTGKAEQIEIYLNGRKLDSLGKGVVRGILITHEGVELPE